MNNEWERNMIDQYKKRNLWKRSFIQRLINIDDKKKNEVF